jgi:predicted transcriptional regulator/DNA-binding XRE family transcriptional regulator
MTNLQIASTDAPKSDTPKLGGRIRRLRRQEGLSQAALAIELGISASYLNLIEHNRRNLTVPLLIKLAERFELELSEIAESDEGRLSADLMEAFGDDLFGDIDLTTTDVRDLVTSNSTVARAILALYDRYRNMRDDAETVGAQARTNHDDVTISDRLPSEQVSDFLQARANYFPELEESAERVNHDSSLSGEDTLGAMSTFLTNTFGVRVMDMPEDYTRAVRRFDPDSRILGLSKMLPADSRNFQAAHQIGLLAADREIDMLVDEGDFTNEDGRTLARIALANYFAGALLMPYDTFHKAAKTHRYDVELLQHRFGVSFEQACHRLTTLQRPRKRGVPFHLLRADIAGNISKRFSLSGIHIPRHGGACPRWNVYTAFLQPGTINVQISQMPDGKTFFCIARTVHKANGGYGQPRSYLSIGLGCEMSDAAALVYADGINLERPERIVPIGVSCRTCPRMDCGQRAFPPVAHALETDENARGVSAYSSASA